MIISKFKIDVSPRNKSTEFILQKFKNIVNFEIKHRLRIRLLLSYKKIIFIISS